MRRGAALRSPRLCVRDLVGRVTAMDVTRLNIFVHCKFLRHAGKGLMAAVVASIIGLACSSVFEAALTPGLRSDSAAARAGYAALSVVYATVVSARSERHFGLRRGSPRQPCIALIRHFSGFFSHRRSSPLAPITPPTTTPATPAPTSPPSPPLTPRPPALPPVPAAASHRALCPPRPLPSAGGHGGLVLPGHNAHGSWGGPTRVVPL
jgi:hypothetical protein